MYTYIFSLIKIIISVIEELSEQTTLREPLPTTYETVK